jgi:hypothetical protein
MSGPVAVRLMKHWHEQNMLAQAKLAEEQE